ncbi:hypothetical protein [Aurantimonas coralicida]|uniref:hypothetical protein n=1 Tax=Aurantimonas coralicida TaxID=182270 RepID=UPI001D18D8C9|nr:hypothetical protein [Aurantimonas coralicida]MCC4298153.1 hypothetical protein [Aurantimonas coralicida]
MSDLNAVIWSWIRSDLTDAEAIAAGATVQDLEAAREAVVDGTYRVAIRVEDLSDDEIAAICGSSGRDDGE